MSNYRYYLEPIGPEANEAMAELLNQLGESASSLEHKNKVVKGRKKPVLVMYELPQHAILTIAGHSVHKKHFRAYVQQGEGETRPYVNYKNIGKRLGRTKEVKRVKRKLKGKTDRS